VFPQALVIKNCVDVYPIKVIVSGEVNGQKLDIWSGRQQSLFRKYAKERTQSIAAIKAALEDLKEDFQLEG
jgi:hypothetical protein